MCIANPMKIVSIKNDQALCESDGVTCEVNLGLLTDIKVGEYVLVHAGFALQVMNADEAIDLIGEQKVIRELSELR